MTITPHICQPNDTSKLLFGTTAPMDEIYDEESFEDVKSRAQQARELMNIMKTCMRTFQTLIHFFLMKEFKPIIYRYIDMEHQ